MKKIFTLLFAVGMLAVVAQAQPGQRDNRQFDQRGSQQNNQQADQRGYQQNDQRNNQQNDQRDFNNGFDKTKDPYYNNPYDKTVRYDDRFSMERRMRTEIARINQEYDYKIEKVNCNFFLSRWEKQRQISFLEQQRQWEISRAYAQFSNRDRYDDRNRGYDRHDRSYGRF
jgi:type II secretory pathway pseudopilin PulG